MRFFGSLIALLVLVGVVICFLIASPAEAAGKTLGNTDKITIEDVGKSYYIIGYVEDFALTKRGDLLGLFRSKEARKRLRFFISNAEPGGMTDENISLVRQYSGTVTSLVLEGTVKLHDGNPELQVFCVAIDRW